MTEFLGDLVEVIIVAYHITPAMAALSAGSKMSEALPPPVCSALLCFGHAQW